MKNILNVTAIGRQLNNKKIDEKRIASIYPVKYIDAYECSDNSYVEEFDSKFVPIYAKSPLVIPPCTNRGGIDDNVIKSSTCVLTPPVSFSCIVDYLSITFRLCDYVQHLTLNAEKVELVIEELAPFFPNLKTVPLGKGLFGYRQSLSMSRGDKNIGLIAFDGNNDSCYISISGAGCVGVDMFKLRQYYQSLPGCKITRIDLAHDDLEGEITVHDYKKKYETGEFSIKGTAPSCRFLDDMGSNSGCTLYVGRKKNGKEACIYEKGKQLGDKNSSWVRVEGRIMAVDRVVPFEAMTQCSDFLAACYPPFAFLSANHQYIEILKKSGEIIIDHLIEHASIAYGRLLDTLHNTYRVSKEEIFDLIQRPGIPSRLQLTESAHLNLCPF